MTGLLPFGRVVTRCIAPKSTQFLTRQIAPTSLLRVSHNYNNDLVNSSHTRDVTSVRAFSSSASSLEPETATKPVGRPKAHTGRAPAKKRAVKSTTTSTTTRKSAAGSKTGSKATTKKPKAKSKAKAKPKAKPKPKTKRVPTKTSIAREARQKRNEYKEKALLDEPKKLPENAWLVYSTEGSEKTHSVKERQDALKERSVSYRTLSPEERERINHIVNQNKKQNIIIKNEWLSKYTPTQIREANIARRQLLNGEKKIKTVEGKALSLIKDDRLVKHNISSYLFFRTERLASGDYKGMTSVESSKLTGREWKALSAAEKKPYEDKAAEDMNRYREEVKTVFGTDKLSPMPKPRSKGKSTAAAATTAPST